MRKNLRKRVKRNDGKSVLCGGHSICIVLDTVEGLSRETLQKL